MDEHRIVIVGGGFAGLYAARSLQGAAATVTLVDRRNFHLFQPLLYQVATAALDPAEIASPLRAVLRRQANAQVLLGEVVGFDVPGRRVLLADGELPYDTLVVAAGGQTTYFGNDAWEPLAPGLKTIEDALEIRRRVLLAYEAAEREADPERRRAWLTFVVVGAGPTGVELAGAFSEIARHTLRGDFRRINPSDAQVILVEGADRVLQPFAPDLSEHAQAALRKLGVTVRTGVKVSAVSQGAVTLLTSSGTEIVPARTVVWAAGVQASPLGRSLAQAAGAEVDRAGRVLVQPDLTLAGHPEIFVIGDMTHVAGPDGKPLPGVAPVAMQQGHYVAHTIRARLRGSQAGETPPFAYHDKGSMATIGRAMAIVQMGRLKLTGYPAWLVWLFIHLLYIVEFDNRLLILFNWAWSYLTRNRGARLITGVSRSL